MKSSGAKCAEQTDWILARSPVLSISNHEWNPLSSPFHVFRSCITIEGNSMDGNPLLSRLSYCYSRTQHTAAPCFLPLQKKNCAIEKSAKMAVLYWRHRPLSPDSRHARFCIEPEMKFHVFEGLKRGEEKLIGNLFFRFWYENNMKIRSSN